MNQKNEEGGFRPIGSELPPEHDEFNTLYKTISDLAGKHAGNDKGNAALFLHQAASKVAEAIKCMERGNPSDEPIPQEAVMSALGLPDMMSAQLSQIRDDVIASQARVEHLKDVACTIADQLSTAKNVLRLMKIASKPVVNMFRQQGDSGIIRACPSVDSSDIVANIQRLNCSVETAEKFLEHAEDECEKITGEQKAVQCACGKPGSSREDNGVAAGVHCDECWEVLVSGCRVRSW